MSALLARFKRFWLAAFLALAVLFVVYYLRNELARADATIRLTPVWIVWAALFHAAFLLVAIANWRRIVHVSAGVSLTRYESFRQFAIVSLGKYLPGKVWGAVARGAVLARQGVGARDALLATFHEQYLLLASGVVVTVLCFAPVLGVQLAWITIPVCVAVVFGGFYGQALGLRMLALLAPKRDGNTTGALTSLAAGPFVRLSMQFVLMWILNGMIYASLYHALFSAPVALDRVAALILANTAGITVGFLALFAPGGIGVREGVSSAILASVMPLADALMLGLVFRLWVTVIELGSSVTIIPELRWRHRPAGS